MTDMSHPELVYLDDILGADAYNTIAHVDGWPCMGLRFDSSANVTRIVNVLTKAAERDPGKFAVYTHETMPEQYHFTNSDRIAPIYVVPQIGYVLTNHKDGDDMSKGVSDPFLSTFYA